MAILSPNSKWMAWSVDSQHLYTSRIVPHSQSATTVHAIPRSYLLAVSDRGSVALLPEKTERERVLILVEQELLAYDVYVTSRASACFLHERVPDFEIDWWRVSEKIRLKNGDVLFTAHGGGEFFVHPDISYLHQRADRFPVYVYYNGQEHEMREGIKIGGVLGNSIVAAIAHDVVLLATSLLCLRLATLPDMITKIRVHGTHLAVLCAQGDVFYLPAETQSNPRKIASDVINIGWQDNTLVCVHRAPSQKPRLSFYNP